MASQTNISGATSGDNIKLDNVILEVFSEEIIFQAQPILRFEQLAHKRTDLTVLPGQTIKFLKYNAITASGNLTETTPMETQTISTATLSISVGEKGVALGFSQALINASVTDVLTDASKLLANNYAVFRDSMIRNALLGGTNVLYANAKANRAALVSTDTFNVDLVRDTVELLATNKAPKFSDGYVTVIHPHQGKAIRKDAAWVGAQQYVDPTAIFNGEIGKIEDMRFIETTNVTYIKKTTQQIWADNRNTGNTTAIAANAATDVYQAIAVGEFAVGVADALPVEMRDDGVVDFGRTHRIAWYGIFGAGLLETGHSVILETA